MHWGRAPLLSCYLPPLPKFHHRTQSESRGPVPSFWFGLESFVFFEDAEERI